MGNYELRITNSNFYCFTRSLIICSKDLRISYNFWIGQYGLLWIAAIEIWTDLAQQLMRTKCNKLPFFQRGQRAMMLIESSF